MSSFVGTNLPHTLRTHALRFICYGRDLCCLCRIAVQRSGSILVDTGLWLDGLLVVSTRIWCRFNKVHHAVLAACYVRSFYRVDTLHLHTDNRTVVGRRGGKGNRGIGDMCGLGNSASDE